MEHVHCVPRAVCQQVQHAPKELGRYDEQNGLCTVHRCADIGGSGDRRIEPHIRKKQGILMPLIDGSHYVRIARPEDREGAGTASYGGKRRPPSAAADDRQPPHQITPSPPLPGATAPQDRAATAAEAACRDRRRFQVEVVRVPPRRSSPHCRCTTVAAAPRSGA